jgi:hypothetical protein
MYREELRQVDQLFQRLQSGDKDDCDMDSAHDDAAIDIAIRDSFPASDPPFWTLGCSASVPADKR